MAFSLASSMAPWLIGATWLRVMSLIWSMYCSSGGSCLSRISWPFGSAQIVPIGVLSTEYLPPAAAAGAAAGAGVWANAGTAARVASAARPATKRVFMGGFLLERVVADEA